MSLSVAPAPVPPPTSPDPSSRDAGLVARLGAALAAANVRYCQWTGRHKEECWSRGESDLDLLVDRAHAAAFDTVMVGLGFKPVDALAQLMVPGVHSFYGLDSKRGTLVHVHAHYQIVIGRIWGSHYRLPIETAVLRSVRPATPFHAPSPEWELLLVALRNTLKCSIRELWRGSPPSWLRGLQPYIERLEAETHPLVFARRVARHLPWLGMECVFHCLAALRAGSTPAQRLAARRRLERRLRPVRRRGRMMARWALLPVPAFRGLGRLLDGVPAGRGKLRTGGAFVALVGGDGAGKSTQARGLVQWLGSALLARHFHLGRPPRSITTLCAGAALKIARLLRHPAHGELLRAVCTARDRALLFRRARRVVASGGVAICERYPIPQNQALVGPSGAQGIAAAVQGPLADAMRRWERACYAKIAPPDVVLVLRVDPDIAVRRKSDEPPDYVRSRALIMWNTDWSRTGAYVIDAGRPLTDVAASLRSCVWEAL